MKVYKVVVQLKGMDGKFCSARTWLFHNCLKSKTVLRYEIGKVTRPHFGFIFCFDTIEHADTFRHMYGGRILECVGVPASKDSLICFEDCGLSQWVLELSWREAFKKISECPTIPKGTVFMRTVRPIKEVTYHAS